MPENYDEKIDELLSEFNTNREDYDSILEKINDLEKTVMENFTADSKDFRSKHLIDNKLKTFSTFYGLKLDVLKQKDASLKTEIELSNKVKDKGGDSFMEQMNDYLKNLGGGDDESIENNPFEFGYDGFETGNEEDVSMNPENLFTEEGEDNE